MTAFSRGGLSVYALGPTGTHIDLIGRRTGQTIVTSTGATTSASVSGGLHTVSLPGPGSLTLPFDDPLAFPTEGFTTGAEALINGETYSFVTFIDLYTDLEVNNNCPGQTCGTARAINSITVTTASAVPEPGTVIPAALALAVIVMAMCARRDPSRGIS
jgi:hypothetical protein